MPGRRKRQRSPALAGGLTAVDRGVLATAASVLIAGAAPAVAQTPARIEAMLADLNGGAASSLRFTPSLSLRQTITDNARLSATDRQSEAITELSSGVRMSANTGRLQASVDYSLTASLYANDSDRSGVRDSLRNGLLASFRTDILDQRGAIQGSASVSQQGISAFGTQASLSGLDNVNTTEVTTLRLGANVGERFFGEIDARAGAQWEKVDASSTAAGDRQAMGLSLGLGGGGGIFGWSAGFNRRLNDFKLARDTTLDSAFLGLSMTPDRLLRLSLRAGREWTDALDGSRISSATWGWGVDWIPTPRTQFSYQSSHRYFGRSHNFSFQHRMARSILRYIDTRGIQDFNLARPFTLYELFFQLYASLEPDPVRREELVRAFLRANGLDADAPSGVGFLVSGEAVLRTQQLSLALQGLRTTVVAAYNATSARRLVDQPGLQDDLDRAPRVAQQGVSIGVSHRFSPSSSGSLNLQRTRTPSQGEAQGNDQRSVRVSWNMTTGAHTSVSVGARHVDASRSPSNPYRENAVFGTITYRF